MGALELRIRDIAAGPSGIRRIEVVWQEGATRRAAAAEFGDVSEDEDAERIRWYLEDYAEFPTDPAPEIARDTEAWLARVGEDLFRRVFSSPDAAGIWERARDRLRDVRVEVDTDPVVGAGMPWELLRDPATGASVALGAGEFVRTHLQAAEQPRLPQALGDRLRVLLVIGRPGGQQDVPFRSVASRLVRGGAEQMEGLDLDVLRPATFQRLSEVLHAAHDAGRPYHVVHFDGHGTWRDLSVLGLEPSDYGEESGGATAASQGGSSGGVGVSPWRSGVSASVAGPVRSGQHGYLLFEDPGSGSNIQFVDGPSLGRLLTATSVPVLVINSGGSAHAEARDRPGDTAGSAPEGTGADPAVGAAEDVLTGDVHARILAYGSLAAEVADAGVPGVVAMRYSVYVVTAAQFAADLYAHLLAGTSLGQSVGAARRALAADPTRLITLIPVALQDWIVPVVYEAAPLVLLLPERDAPLVKLSPTDSGFSGGAGLSGVPGPPDAGFYGRDESLLALDRAFDTQRLVLLHAFAGAGKSSTVAEFGRWYQATGGLDHPDHPEWGPGVVLWSSFEHHLTADRIIDTAGDYFSGLLEANGIAWAAVTDPAQRSSIVVQVLAQVPVLWVWDNVEPVTGFPEGTASAWTAAEQDELKDLLLDLAHNTQCKVLLTSRRGENAWLGDLVARVRLPTMPMRESLQLAAALAARRGQSLAGIDWRPLLRYAGGNPLTITVLTGQALRENLTTAEAIAGFVARLEAGDAQLEAGEDAALGRTRSLAASLSYGFGQAFTGAERAQLALLHLFRDTADVDALRAMGGQDALGADAVPALAGLNRETAMDLLDRAAGIGLLESLGGGYYQIHPALPWYFTSLYTTVYGQGDEPPAQRSARAYAKTIGALGDYYHNQAESGHTVQVVPLLGAEEANLRHALDLARAFELWDAATGCLQGLKVLYSRTGRDSEWARLVATITADFTDPATGGPLPGRRDNWSIITSYRVDLAKEARDWPAATTLQQARIAWNRDQASHALGIAANSLTSRQRLQIRNLAAALSDLGHILLEQDDPGCLALFQEALELAQRIGDRAAEALVAFNLGNAYLAVPGLRDLDQAEHWYQHSLNLREDTDWLGRARLLGSLGGLALQRFQDARAASQSRPLLLLEHLNAAIRSYQQALDLIPPDDYETRAITEHQLGIAYSQSGEFGQALRHYQQAIQHEEARGNIFGAGQTRYNIALLLEDDGRIGDGLLYARAALANFQQAGPGAASDAQAAEQLIGRLELRNR
jgi:tetratricopeptide (TPR) repeat protein